MLNNDWDEYLKDEFAKPYFRKLVFDVTEDYKNYPCYPPIHQVFQALRECSYQQTVLVILGQDPYHNEGEAMGLSFSVPNGIPIPPSLQNIYQEMHTDLNINIPTTGDLTPWAKQGVLLLNSILSVRKNQPLSHQQYGWETFTDAILKLINQKNNPVVFWLFGAYARKKRILLTNPNHLLIEAPHPSPLSAYRGFFGSQPFSKTNAFLKSKGLRELDFRLT